MSFSSVDLEFRGILITPLEEGEERSSELLLCAMVRGGTGPRIPSAYRSAPNDASGGKRNDVGKSRRASFAPLRAARLTKLWPLGSAGGVGTSS